MDSAVHGLLPGDVIVVNTQAKAKLATVLHPLRLGEKLA